MYETEFTSEAVARVICQRCKESFPAGTELIYMHNINPSHPGRKLCEGCHKYYQEKGTTRRRSAQPGTSTSGVREQVSESHSVVRRQIAAAQRGEGIQPVVPIGNVVNGMLVVPTTSQPPHVIPGRQYKFNSINVVAPLNPYSTLPFPNTKNTPLVNPGYQEAHSLYNDMQKHYADRAYPTAANAEVVVVKIWMMTRVPNKKNPLAVSNVFEAVSDIPVHIGVKDLKFVAYHAILPHFLKWSKNCPLLFEECELRTKLWVELIPKNPDVDAIADKFFDLRGKNKATKIFPAKQGIDLYLAISNEKFESIQAHLANNGDNDDGDKFSKFHMNVAETSKQASAKSRKIKKRKIQDFEDEPHNSEPDSTLKPMSSTNSQRHTLPEAADCDSERVQRALEFQVPPRRKNMKLLFDTITIDLQFFRPPLVSFDDLLRDPHFLLDPQGFTPTQISLTYSPSARQSVGGFKIASIATGHTSSLLFGGTSNKVCYKQCYHAKPGSGARQIYQGAFISFKVETLLSRVD